MAKRTAIPRMQIDRWPVETSHECDHLLSIVIIAPFRGYPTISDMRSVLASLKALLETKKEGEL